MSAVLIQEATLMEMETPEDCKRIFAIKKDTEILVGTIRAFDMSRAIILSFLSHGVISSELTKYRRPVISIAKIAIKVNIFKMRIEIFREITIT